MEDMQPTCAWPFDGTEPLLPSSSGSLCLAVVLKGLVVCKLPRLPELNTNASRPDLTTSYCAQEQEARERIGRSTWPCCRSRDTP